MKEYRFIWESLRPWQWTKNLFVFSGILFSQNVFNFPLLFRVIYAFFIFCLLAGSVYILNDLTDLKEDRRHPIKSRRPLASGRLKTSNAILALVIILPFSLGMAYCLDLSFFLVTLIYLLLQVFYSFFLKHIVILDVFIVACGFLLRVIAGAVVIDVEISSWLLICTIFLSLFLALGKRKFDPKYSPYLLDQMIFVVSAAAMVAYVLYTLSEETISKFGTRNLIFTVPFVFYGIFRYLYLIYQKGAGGNPENILIKDIPLIVDILLWVSAVGIILYAG